ncbi:MAG: sulfatase [Pseudonocardiales bacterium]|nr:MAG: sulfatase [Pseudonocardiales bacterium]
MQPSRRYRRYRRCLVSAVVMVALVLAACTPSSATHRSTSTPAPPTGKPNIVFVLTDDLAWNLVQYLPHVVAMQKAGITLSNYYVIDSLCCPSRSAIFTGEYPHDDGVFTNGGNDGGYDTFNAHGNQPNTFAVALQKSGYQTGFMGKYLNGYLPADKPAPGWNEWDVAGNGYPEFNYTLNENGTQHSYGKDPSDYLTDVISAKASSFIDRSAAAGMPFMLELATFAPHHPSTPAPRDADKFPGLTAPRTAAFDVQPSGAPAWLKAIPPLTAKNTKQIDDEFRLRVQSVQAVDAMIGHLQQQLQDKGLAKNTYIVFSSDNGYHMGEHQLRPGKQTAFDTDIKVPLMVTGPGLPAGKDLTQMTSSIDLAPTFEGLSGAPVPATVDGTSLSPLWHGQSDSSGQQAVLVEHHGQEKTPNDPDKPTRASGDPPSYEAVRTANALYVQYTDGEREFYDVAKDPNELTNLAATASAAQLAPLQQALTALQNCHNAPTCRAAAQLG